MEGRPAIKILDVMIILSALALTGFSAYAAYIKPQKKPQVFIRGQERTWIFPLDAEETVVVPGPLGNTVVRIHENQAWVESSPCVNKTCVAQGHVQRRGAWAACLPNIVFLLIEGNNDPVIDAYSW
jgi:hypothetical protein